MRYVGIATVLHVRVWCEFQLETKGNLLSSGARLIFDNAFVRPKVRVLLFVAYTFTPRCGEMTEWLKVAPC